VHLGVYSEQVPTIVLQRIRLTLLMGHRPSQFRVHGVALVDGSVVVEIVLGECAERERALPDPFVVAHRAARRDMHGDGDAAARTPLVPAARDRVLLAAHTAGQRAE
jgi:hypothetical protein